MKHPLTLVVAAVATCLSACGGNPEPTQQPSPPAREARHPTATATAGAADTAPNTAAEWLRRTSITRAQAAWLEDQLAGRVLRVDCRPGDDEALADQVGTTLLQVVVDGLGPEVPVLVGGADLQRAAELVARLKASGMTRVLLVTT
jgi:hypothetical protein